MIFCTKCGSRSHSAYDCSAPDQKLTPPSDDSAIARAYAEQKAREPIPVEVPAPEPEPIFEPGPPRFKGCPPICTQENLPSFKDKEAMKAFQERLLSVAIRQWQCEFCGGYHYEAKVPSPAGSSSGTERDSKLPPNFRPFIRKSTKAKTEMQSELPSQAPPKVIPPKKRIDNPLAKTHKKREGELF